MQSKKDSIYDIILDLKPEIALFTETHLKTNASFKINGHSFFGETRTDKCAGGVGILVRDDLKHCVTPHTSNRDIEITWISIKRGNMNPSFIGVYYGKQESRVNKEEIEEEMDLLMEEILEMKSEGEVLLVMDGNGKIGVLGEPVSRNGKLLLDVFSGTCMEIMNLTAKCVGKVTRIGRKQNENNSAIDYVIASSGFSQCIQSMIIDEEGLHRLKGKTETDHNSIILKMNLRNMTKINREKNVVWRLNAPDEAWEEYRRRLQRFAITSQNLMNDKKKVFQHRYNLWINELTRIITQTIGKTTIKGNNEKFSQTVKDLRNKKKELKKNFHKEQNPEIKKIIKTNYVEKQKQLQEMIRQERQQNVEKQFKDMIESGTNDGFWKQRKKIQRDNTTEWMITKNDLGKRLYDPQENLENVANYYENLYKREVEQNHAYHYQIKSEMEEFKQNLDHEIESYNDSPDLEMIKKAITNKKNKKSTTDIKNEFLKKGGLGIVRAIHSVIQVAWQEEIIPSQWNESVITSIWKNKGDRELMKNQRGISVSSSIGMIMEEIINDRILEIIEFTPAQGGGIKEYSTCDHVFLIRSLMTYSMKMNRRLILTFYDVQKAYDRAEREDMMHILWKKGVRGKLWRLTCALNDNLTSMVKTPYGMSRQIKREVGGKQGGKIMTTTFSKTMDMLAEDMGDNDQVGVKIKNIKLSSLLFVDDVTTIADNYIKQEKTLEEVDLFATKHCLTWGIDKCAVMEIGRHVDVKLKWKLGNQFIDHQDSYKYLGDIVTRDGRNMKNIEERFRKIKKSTYSIITCGKSEIMKRIEIGTLIKLHETINIPILLHNSESWIMTKTDRLNLEKIEMWALKRMFSLPRTTPSVAIRYITGTLYVKTRIDIRQMLFLWKTLTKPDESWPKKLLTILDEFNLGWADQIRQTLSEYGVTENWEEIRTKTKLQWKSEVYSASEKRNKEMMIDECYKDNEKKETKTKTKTIIEKLSNDDYDRKPLQNIVKLKKLYAKAIIMGRYGMLDCSVNYKGKYGKTECRLCKERDDEQHRLECPKWTAAREGQSEMAFLSVYNDDVETLRKIAKYILDYWEIDHGKNRMRVQCETEISP